MLVNQLAQLKNLQKLRIELHNCKRDGISLLELAIKNISLDNLLELNLGVDCEIDIATIVINNKKLTSLRFEYFKYLICELNKLKNVELSRIKKFYCKHERLTTNNLVDNSVPTFLFKCNCLRELNLYDFKQSHIKAIIKQIDKFKVLSKLILSSPEEEMILDIEDTVRLCQCVFLEKISFSFVCLDNQKTFESLLKYSSMQLLFLNELFVTTIKLGHLNYSNEELWIKYKIRIIQSAKFNSGYQYFFYRFIHL